MVRVARVTAQEKVLGAIIRRVIDPPALSLSYMYIPMTELWLPNSAENFSFDSAACLTYSKLTWLSSTSARACAIAVIFLI